jgi:hypothetical protein
MKYNFNSKNNLLNERVKLLKNISFDFSRYNKYFYYKKKIEDDKYKYKNILNNTISIHNNLLCYKDKFKKKILNISY